MRATRIRSALDVRGDKVSKNPPPTYIFM